MAVAQGGLGYLQYSLGVPPMLVMLHVVGAVAFFLLILHMHLGWFERATEVSDPLPARDLVRG